MVPEVAPDTTLAPIFRSWKRGGTAKKFAWSRTNPWWWLFY